MALETQRPLKLRCSVRNYEWGRFGEESTVATLFARNSGEKIDSGRPYAELWMGTHDSGHSFVELGLQEEPVTLKAWVEKNPTFLGEKVVERWGKDIPFLFKVLSIAKALSIQAHPDKELAKLLHETQPELYKDANHKPEIAIAISDFKALCGFVSVKELKDVLANVPEILELVGNENARVVMNIKEQDGHAEARAALQSIFTSLVTTSEEAVSQVVKKLCSRLSMEQKVRTLTEKEELVLLLEKHYPADVGLISAFLLNYVTLRPGEALYIDADEPHAYVFGDCVECMATSDNVVRAGLTPKYRDVKTLCSMLTYKHGCPEIFPGESLSPFITRYRPPFDEFEVERCLLPSGERVVLSETPGPSIVIVLSGIGWLQKDSLQEDVSEGSVFFIPAKVEVTFGAADTTPLELYRAAVNSLFFHN